MGNWFRPQGKKRRGTEKKSGGKCSDKKLEKEEANRITRVYLIADWVSEGRNEGTGRAQEK